MYPRSVSVRKKSDFNSVMVERVDHGWTRSATDGNLTWGSCAGECRTARAASPSHAANRANPFLSLLGPPVFHVRGEACEIESRRRETGFARTVLDEAVRDADVV